jgi:hypothetical protein
LIACGEENVQVQRKVNAKILGDDSSGDDDVIVFSSKVHVYPAGDKKNKPYECICRWCKSLYGMIIVVIVK